VCRCKRPVSKKIQGKINLKAIGIVKPAGLAKPALYGLLLIGVYYSCLAVMISQWGKEDYSYCYLMPLVILYLIWEKKNKLVNLASVSSWWGMLPFGAGIILFWFGELGGEYLTLYISFWLVIVGLCWLHLGWKKLKSIGFALFLILTMFPLPNFLYIKISVKLKLLSSQLGVAIMHLCGMSAHREGNIIDLGFTQLQVVDACSGLRYLIPLIVLGIILAYFFKAALWKRAILVVSMAPLSIITNGLRIALTGILYEVRGPGVVEGFFHGFSGWFIFMVSIGILLIEMWILNKIGRRHTRAFEEKSVIAARENKVVGGMEHGAEDGRQTREYGGFQGFIFRSLFYPPQFIVAVVLLCATLAFSHGIEFRENIPIKKSFDQFPLKAGEWTGVSRNMGQEFIDALDLSDYALIEFQDRLGRHVNFYAAYYESQRKGESIHSPATCLPGGGWTFNQAGAVTIPLPAGDSGLMRVNRAFMQKSGYKQLAYYWFPQRGRILTNAYELKLYAFWDALTKQRTDGALVRLITPVYEFEEPEDAEARLQGFTREIVPLLGEFIPGRNLGE